MNAPYPLGSLVFYDSEVYLVLGHDEVTDRLWLRRPGHWTSREVGMRGPLRVQKHHPTEQGRFTYAFLELLLAEPNRAPSPTKIRRKLGLTGSTLNGRQSAWRRDLLKRNGFKEVLVGPSTLRWKKVEE